MKGDEMTRIECECGEVALALKGAPILTTACFCDDCQAGSQMIAELPDAPQVQEDDGSSAYVLWRKDWVSFERGKEKLENYTLADDAPTDRVVASCCNSAIFLNFRKAHWFSLYRQRFEEPPELEFGVFTKFMPDFDPKDTELRCYRRFPLRFIGKVALARLAMLVSR